MADESRQSEKPPMMSPGRQPRVTFGDVCFDAHTGEVQRGGSIVRLTPKAAEVLAILVQRAPALVSKEELATEVWNGKAIGDDAVTSCIRELRKALDDNARRPQHIETRHRRGYRLIGPVGWPKIPGIGNAGATSLAVAPEYPSIAVLPFENMSGDPEQVYFADGLAEDLITALSRVTWLFVIARNSSFSLRDAKLDARTIGERLGVRYLVEGSVRRAGQRLRLTVQLIEAATGNHLWAERYDGALEDAFDFQDRIVISLVGAIEPKLRTTEVARARRKHPDNLDAFDLLLQALPKITLDSAQGFAEAIELLDRAIALSPAYARALANAALCRMSRPFQGYSPNVDRDLQEAAELCRRALDCDPTDPNALRIAGLIAVMMHRDYQTGLDLIDRCLAIDPNSVYAWSARGWINTWAGETDAAVSDFGKALRLSPLDPYSGPRLRQGMAFALCTGGRPLEALPWARKVLQENPESSGIQRPLIAALWLSGQHLEAKESAKNYNDMFPGFSLRRWIETGPFRGTPGQRQVYEALREAGLPE